MLLGLKNIPYFWLMETIKKILKNFLRKLKNPFIFIGLLFLLWMLFFDSNSYLNHRKLSKSIKQLEKDKLHYRNEIQKDSIAIEELSSPKGLEKYVGSYHMKKENEEIFLIVE